MALRPGAYTDHGVTLLIACCACGGGTAGGETPSHSKDFVLVNDAISRAPSDGQLTVIFIETALIVWAHRVVIAPGQNIRLVGISQDGFLSS